MQAFHEAIAFSSGNRLISYLFEAMAPPLRHSFHLSRRGHELRGHTTFDNSIAAHNAILEAIRDGNSEGGGSAMRPPRDTERDIRLASIPHPG